MSSPRADASLRVLVWHVHGTWTTSFVQGRHRYLLPTLPEGGQWGGGRCGRDWPDAAQEVAPADLADAGVDVVVLQRPDEIEVVRRWLGARPGTDLPAVYLEHNTPKGDVPHTRHPLAEQDRIPIVHVTHFNELIWDSGLAPTVVVEHGIVDPGERYTGELERAAVVVNEPIRRWRVTGTDLLPRFAEAAPLDVFGMRFGDLPDRLGVRPGAVTWGGDLRPAELYPQLARRRAYVHPMRWTSLGLSLIEAMQLGMPVVAVGTTEAAEAVPPEAGVVSTRIDVLVDGLRMLCGDPAAAHAMGKRARAHALRRYGLPAFLDGWDRVLADVTGR